MEACGTPRRFSILLAPARTCPHLSAPARTCPHLPARCRPCQPFISPARSFLGLLRLRASADHVGLEPVRTCPHLSAPVSTCPHLRVLDRPYRSRIAPSRWPSRCALCLVAHAVPPPSSQCAHGLLCQMRMSSRCNTDISATGTAHRPLLCCPRCRAHAGGGDPEERRRRRRLAVLVLLVPIQRNSSSWPLPVAPLTASTSATSATAQRSATSSAALVMLRCQRRGHNAYARQLHMRHVL